MMFTTPMKLLVAVVLADDSDGVTKELLRLGALDFIGIKELSGQWQERLSAVNPEIPQSRTAELRKRVEGLFQLAGKGTLLPELPGSEIATVNLADTEKTLDAVAEGIQEIRERQKGYQEEILKLDEIRRQVELFDDPRGGIAARSSHSFLAIRTGSIQAKSLPELEKSLRSFPSVIVPSGSTDGPRQGALLVTMKRDDARIEEILARHGWEQVDLPPGAATDKAEAVRELRGKISRLKSEQDACAAELSGLISGKSRELAALWTGLRTTELYSRVQSSFSKSRRTLLFSGWIPEAKRSEVDAGIREAARGGCYLEWIGPEEGEARNVPVPVEMSNPKILKPFETLVKNYAIPEYGSIDPTPFVAVAYLSMFGLMFGDAGHGLVLALVGILGGIASRRKGKGSDIYRLMLYCGAAAIASGILFGSYFGSPLFPPLWFDYHGIISGRSEHAGGLVRDVYDILGITIKFGICILAAGLALNWVNLVRKRRWLELLLDKGGILGGWIYGAGTWTAFYFVNADYTALPPGGTLLLILGLPTLLVALKAPIEFIGRLKHGGKRFSAITLVDFLMEWIVEVLEIYSGYLANTLSFMRVAGLGIAHVSLMLAFFQIARMVSPAGPISAWGYAVIVVGNALVIALEGLSAAIQALRLNYYEFFSKYFNGTGKAYRPISLRSKD